MLVPRWILGGILAATLGLTGGLAARAELPPPPGAMLSLAAPDVGTDAEMRLVALNGASQAALRPGIRPQARPDGVAQTNATVSGLRPQARDDILPATRWDNRDDGATWTRAALSAINAQRHDLSDQVPRDIAAWCPAYPANPERQRDAFWVGVLSVLARTESMLDPSAVGGGGLYHGLLQISPATARHYECAATTGPGLQDAAGNLACGARIISATVNRDDAVALYDGRWRGVAADWGPLTNSDKRAEMSAWTREQDYCVISTAVLSALRPVVRPWVLTTGHGDIPVADAIELAMVSGHGPGGPQPP